AAVSSVAYPRWERYWLSSFGCGTAETVAPAESNTTARSTDRAGSAASGNAYTPPSLEPTNARCPSMVGELITAAPVRNEVTTRPVLRSRTSRRPTPSPTYTWDADTAGDDQTMSLSGVRQRSCPVAASTAWKNAASEEPT